MAQMSDALQRPRTEEELTRQLADTIGSSVEQLLGQSGWSEANNALIDPRTLAGQPGQSGGGEERPAAAPTSGQPAQAVAPVAPASPSLTPEIASQLLGFNVEEYKDANGQYLHGKYPSLGAFVKGIGHAMNMTKHTLDENAQLRTQIEELRRTPVAPQVTAPVTTPKETPTRGDIPEVGKKLAEALASFQEDSSNPENLLRLTDAISEHTAEVARQAAREEAQGRDRIAQATKDRWDKVDAYMLSKYPASMQFTDEMGIFSKTNPEIGQVVSALIEKDLHEQAMTYLWREFAAVHGVDPAGAPQPFVPAPPTKENVEKEIKLDAADQVRREAVEQARKDAGVITSGGNHGVHENADAGVSQEEMAQAIAQLNAGHGERFRALVFKDILNHPLLN